MTQIIPIGIKRILQSRVWGHRATYPHKNELNVTDTGSQCMNYSQLGKYLLINHHLIDQSIPNQEGPA